MKKKRELTARQIESLAKGRESLRQRHEQKRKERIDDLLDAYLDGKRGKYSSTELKRRKKKITPTPLRSPEATSPATSDDDDEKTLSEPEEREKEQPPVRSLPPSKMLYTNTPVTHPSMSSYVPIRTYNPPPLGFV